MNLALLITVLLATSPEMEIWEPTSEVTGFYEDDDEPLAEYLFASTGTPWNIASTLLCTGESMDPAAPTCSGVPLTKAGTPTQVDAPLWPNGFGAAAAKGIYFDGTGSFAVGSNDFLDAPSKLLMCADFRMPAAQFKSLLAKGNFAGGAANAYTVYETTNKPTTVVTKAGGTYSSLGSDNAAAVGARMVACTYYQFVADGTSIMRLATVDEKKAIANAVGPIQPVAFPLSIGGVNGTTGSWTDSVYSVVLAGAAELGAWSPSLDEMQALVRARYGMTGTRGEPVTVTGPATTVEGPGGTAWTTPANTLAIGPQGALVYGARTSRILKNQRDPAATSTGGMTAANWTKRGTASVAAGCVTAPDGSCTAEEITVGTLAGVNDVYEYAGGFGANATLASALWVQRVSTSGTLVAMNVADGDRGQWQIDVAAVGAEWVRITGPQTGVSQVSAWQANATGQGGFDFAAASGTVTVRIWRPWQVEGAVPGPDAYVNGSALAVAATAATTSNGLVGIGTDWCVTVTATPTGRAWNAITADLWSAGAPDAANSTRLEASTNGNLYFYAFDAAAAAKYRQASMAGFTAGTEHTITACNASGTLTLHFDGSPAPGASGGGAGTGIVTTPAATFAFGAVNTSGATAWNGSIKRTLVCRTSDPERCQ
jgi:hypothetical protein